MRRFVSAAALLLALALVLPAPAGAKSYVALYTGETDENWCACGTVPYTIELWIVAVPGPEGMHVAAFNFDMPDNAVPADLTGNPIATQLIGGPEYALQFSTCLLERTWLIHGDVAVLSDEQTEIVFTGPIEFYPNPGEEQERYYRSCEEGYPKYDLDPLTHLYLNRDPSDPLCGTTGVEAASWGAIKGIILR